MKTKGIHAFIFLMLIFTVTQLFTACEADLEIDKTVDEIKAAQPTIESVSPNSAAILSRVTITGTFLNFAEKAFIGDVECQITQRINGNTLEIEVAPQALTGIIKIVTSSNKEALSAEVLTVTYPTPNVTSTFPVNALVNQNITIEGSNLKSITRISFGDVDGVIQFQEDQALVVSIPNNETSPLIVNYYYNSTSGLVSQVLSSDFTILIPTPIISAWPTLMNRDSEVLIVGTDMNLITSVSVGGSTVTVNSSTPTSISFNVPGNVVTGYQDIVVNYGTNGKLTHPLVPYINGQFESYIDFDSYAEDVFVIDLSKDPLATQQLNDVVAQHPFSGSSYYNLKMNTGTGSTIARMRMNAQTNNDTWSNIIDAGNFNDNPVLHFWMNTEGTEPILKLYIGGTSNPNRRELKGANTNTGDNWKLFAVRLNGFIPTISTIGSTFEFRFNTGSGATTFPVKVNLDWIIVTDSVLTEFGAVDVTDSFGAAG
jgi:hypothetical protein